MTSNKQQLYRQEAIDFQSKNWYGEALLISKMPTSLVLLFAIFFTVVSILLITMGSYSRRIIVKGETISFPHPITIRSSEGGYINNVFVNMTDVVKKGESLYEINIDKNIDTGSLSENKIASLTAQINNIETIIYKTKESKRVTLENLELQLAAYEEIIVETERSVENMRHEVEVMEIDLKQYNQLKEDRLISKEQQNNQRYNLNQNKGTLLNLLSQQLNNKLQLNVIKSDLLVKATDFDNKISESESQRENLLAQLFDTKSTQSLLITSPIDARVESISVTKGQMVEVNSSVLQLKPIDEDNIIKIVLWVPNSAIPYVSVNDDINIRYSAFPHEKYGQFKGTIESISSVPASQDEIKLYGSKSQSGSNPDPNGAAETSYYKAIVKFPAPHIYHNNRMIELISGMSVEVTLFLEDRKIYEWMFAPIYNVSKSLTGIIND